MSAQNVFRIGTVVVFVGILCSCSTIRNGGAPAPAFNQEEDLRKMETAYAQSAKIEALLSAPDIAKRNAFMDARMSIIDMRFNIYVRDLAVDKRYLDTGNDITLLALSLAGASTGAVRAGKNLATAAAGVAGVKIAIDKHFYFQQTIPALISSMSAKRKEVFLRMLEGRKLDIEKYPFSQLQNDLSAYELASSLDGAIDTLLQAAAAKDAAATANVQRAMLEVPTDDELDSAATLASAIATLKADTPANLAKMNAVLKELKLIQTDVAAFKDAKDLLVKSWRGAKLADLGVWKVALRKAQVLQ